MPLLHSQTSLRLVFFLQKNVLEIKCKKIYTISKGQGILWIISLKKYGIEYINA